MSELSRQEAWQREIYDARKAQYQREPLPTAQGLPGLLLTFREHVRMVDRLAILPSHTVLDIGCSNGQMLNFIKRRYGASGTGIDLSAAAVESALLRNPGSSFLVAGADRALPFKEASFDRVVCFDVVEHLENPSRLMIEIRRVLKPGGKALFHIPVSDIRGSMDWWLLRFYPSGQKQMMSDAGHDYAMMLSKRGYEKLATASGLHVTFSRRYNALLQNIFDYRITHRLLNRLFFVWRVPLDWWHSLVGPTVEAVTSLDRILQAFDVGASMYMVVSID